MGLAHLRMPGLAQGPQESAPCRVLGLAQGPQELAHRQLLGLAPGPQEPANRRAQEPERLRAQEPEPEHLQVLGLVKGLECLRVRLMDSPQLGELLGFLPEAVLFPHLHHQNPQELAQRRVGEPPRVQEQVKWGMMQEPAQPVFPAQVPQLSPAEPLESLAQGCPPPVRVVLAVLEVVPRSC